MPDEEGGEWKTVYAVLDEASNASPWAEEEEEEEGPALVACRRCSRPMRTRSRIV